MKKRTDDVFARAVLVAAVAVFAAVAAHGIDVTFSKENGDLALPADWGMESLPDSTNRIAFAASGSAMTATASADISYAGIIMKKSNQTVTLDMRDSVSGASPRHVNLTGSVTFGDYHHQTLNIKGGVWDTGNSIITTFGGSYNNSRRYATVNITDGALVRTAGLRGDYSADSHSLFHIAGEGTVVTSGYISVPFIDAKYDCAEIVDGAKVIITNNTNGGVEIGRRDSYYCGLTISGAGSRLQKIRGGTTYLGAKRSHNFLRVENGGEFLQGSGLFYFAHSDGDDANNATNNSITVSGPGSRFVFGAMYFGRGGASALNSHNEMQVFDGGVVTGSIVYAYGHDNGLVVSNASMVLSGGNGIVCQESCTNLYLRMQGDRPSFTIPTGGGGNFEFINSFKFIYDLPPDGYPENWIPVNLVKWGRSDDTTEVVVNGIEAVRRRMSARRISRQSFNLLKTTGGIGGSGFTSAMLARWNSYLPEGASLSLKGGILTLTVENQIGTMIIVK